MCTNDLSKSGGWTRRVAVCGAVAVAALVSGCGRVGAVVGSVLGNGPPDALDAHAVYRMRPDCPTLVARTIRHGFTVLTPRGGGPFEVAGVFEGPARVGESVFRYVPPEGGASWEIARSDASTAEVSVAVAAVDVELPDVRQWLDRQCGPLPPGEGEPGEEVPRVPALR